jgi:DNA-binding XRE family transcriptional regulator
VTIALDVAAPATGEDKDWFRQFGTTGPTLISGPRKFIACVVVAGCAATGTLAAVTPADAVALNTIVAQPSTLPAVSAAQPAAMFDQSIVPGLLQRIRRTSGLTWGELGRAIGVSRRTIHNWLGGAHVAGIHLARLLEVSRVFDLFATGSAESTRTRLLRPSANGRSIVDDLALAARPARRRPLSSLSVGDLVTPVNETASANPPRSQRRSGLRGGPLPRRRLDES